MQLDEVTDVQQLSALTASPQLTSLHLLARFSMPLPMGALQHLLPPGLQLPLLRVLRLQGGDGVSEQQCLGASDVERVADCCPHLTDLTLKGVLSVGASLEPLLRLRASLQALSVAGAAFGDAAAGCVAKLTGLQALEWSDSVGLTDAGVQQLTGLRQLRRLSVKSCKGLSRAILPPDDWYKASQLVLEAGVQVRGACRSAGLAWRWYVAWLPGVLGGALCEGTRVLRCATGFGVVEGNQWAVENRL